ncbi:hypothetical protein GCM10027040_17450 [Halomonas shantousis]
MPQRPVFALLLISLLVWTASIAAASAADPANPLITDRGLFRPLVLVTPDADNAAYQRMREQLRRRQDDLRQRQMVLYSVEAGSGQRTGQAMTPFETRALLKALGIDPQGPMTVILIGMDGGKKMQLEGYVDPQQVFDIVDNMPRRTAGPTQPSRSAGAGTASQDIR